MKWTLIVVGLIGSVAYAVIFFAQNDHDQARERAIATDVPTEVEVVDRNIAELPTFESGAVDSFAPAVQTPEDFAASTPEPATVAWTGDAWTAGVEAFENADFALARKALEVAVSEKETSPYRHYLLGLTYRRTGDPESAVAELRRSLELAPGQVRALVNLGRVHLDLEDTVQAREAIDDALDLDLEFADAWQVLGRIELAEANFEEAAAAFAKAAAKDPQHAWAWNNLGYVRIQQERFAEAVQPLRQALATGREEAVFYNNLGVALERTGHEDLAVLAYGRAVVLGHAPAETSHARVEEILIARHEIAPDFDTIEELDALTLAALVPAVEETASAAAVDSFETSLGALEDQEFEELLERR